MKLFVKVRNSLGEEATAELPYETGKYTLPDVAPFSLNQYLGPDDGFSLREIDIDAENSRVYYGHADSIEVSQEEKEAKIEMRTKTIWLSFRLGE